MSVLDLGLEGTSNFYPACLRSGFCCKKVPCGHAVARGHTKGPCPLLRGDKPGNYSCGLVDDGEIRPDDIYAATGCCSNMNTDRHQAVANVMNVSYRGKEPQ